MLDMTIVILSAVISPLIAVIGTYAILKKMQKSDVFLDILEDILQDIADNPDLQKKVYTTGGILGAGIRQGLGLQRGKGKLKLEDLVLQFISGYIQKGMPQQQPAVGVAIPQTQPFQQP